MDYVISTRTKDFNGVNLFDGSKVDVVIDPDGNTFPVGGVDLFSAVYESALKKQSWQLTGNAWQTSKSGYQLNQTTYEITANSFKLTSDLWYNGGTWATSDNGGQKYDAGTFVRNDGATITADPPGANTIAFASGQYTTVDLSNPNNAGLGLLTDGVHFTSHPSGTFLASDPAGNGDLQYQHRGAVAKGHYIGVDPSTEDAAATSFSSGATIITDQDLSAAPFNATDLGGVEIATIAGAKASLNVIFKALDELHLDRASLGAIQQRVEFTSDQLISSNQNLTQAKSRITDVDVASETTEYAKQQILVQSGTQMLRQANSLPQTALELLR
jgi:flagellin-like hook-associated protein FlgL